MSQSVEERARRRAKSYRVRRQRRSAVVILLVLLGLGGAFYYASTYFTSSSKPSGPCTTQPVTAPLVPGDVSLNVYNATGRAGLAGSAAATARDRGFTVKSVGNDPKNARIKQAAQVRYGPAGAASAKLVLSHLRGAVGVNDKRAGDTVDLVLGNAWKAFGPAPAVATPTQTLRPCASSTAVS
ncbi:MAG: hypothetical protein JWP82_1517 [Humibacillus sp.]|nr:hypothetical protein [Humibacillus sp.]